MEGEPNGLLHLQMRYAKLTQKIIKRCRIYAKGFPPSRKQMKNHANVTQKPSTRFPRIYFKLPVMKLYRILAKCQSLVYRSISNLAMLQCQKKSLMLLNIHISAFVLGTREQRLVEHSQNSNIPDTVGSHNNYDNNNTNSNSAHFLSFVVKFSSYCVRDNVAFKCSKLAKFDCNSLFGKRGNKHIFLRPPQPKPIFQLWRNCMEANRRLKYAKSVVRN